MGFVDVEPVNRLKDTVLIEGPAEAPGKADHTALAVHHLLTSLGQDVERPGLERTPDRVAATYRELLAGYEMDARTLVNGALFPAEYQGIALVRDIEFHSLCEHHLLPFFGRAHVAYLPDRQVIGLSKIPRLVDMFARRLQLQEQLTQQIAECLANVLAPRGVAVAVEAVHTCMMIRGVQKTGARMVTRTLLGAFAGDPEWKRELDVLMGALGSAPLL